MPSNGEPDSQHRRRRQTEEQPLRDLWRAVVAYDLAIIWKVQGIVQGWPNWVQRNLERVVSHHPLRDISTVTWFAFLFGCQVFGFHFFWACCLNLVSAGFVRFLLSAPRPCMFDQRLQPLTDRYGTSHGLPSLETHMATVVTGWWAESAAGGGQQQPLAWVVAVGYVFFVGFTRVYACSRFVHQVALSCVSGYAGLALGWRLSLHLDGLGILIKHHFFGTAAVVVIALGVLAFHVENNDSQLLGVKKHEYLRVLAEIMKEGMAQSAVVEIGGTDADANSAWEMERDVSLEDRAFSTRPRRRRLEDRRDSFYFLQRAIERRAAQSAAFRRSMKDYNDHSRNPHGERSAPAAMGWANRMMEDGDSGRRGRGRPLTEGDWVERHWVDERSVRKVHETF